MYHKAYNTLNRLAYDILGISWRQRHPWLTFMFSHSLRPFGCEVRSCLLPVWYPIADHRSISHALEPLTRLSAFVCRYFAAFRCAVVWMGALDVAVLSYKRPLKILWHLNPLR